MTKEIIISLVMSATMVGAAFILSQGMDKEDRINCLKLQQQEKDYPTFYSTDIEKRICREFGITLNK
jgi:hypothetical protein